MGGTNKGNVVRPTSGSNAAEQDQREGFPWAHVVSRPGVAFLPENT